MSDTAGMSASQAASLQEASMATSAMSSITSTVTNVGAIKAQGSYESTLANTNAAMAKLKASQTLEAGDLAASRKALQTQAQVGTVKAQQAASGVDVGSGSSAMVRAGIQTAGGIDEATIRNNAARSAWGYQTQALQDTFQGQFSQLTAQAKTTQAIATGGLGAISGPLNIYARQALLQYRYGGRGTGGMPYPTGGANSDGSDFWDQ